MELLKGTKASCNGSRLLSLWFCSGTAFSWDVRLHVHKESRFVLNFCVSNTVNQSLKLCSKVTGFRPAWRVPFDSSVVFVAVTA
jgi:hypothetical protein